MRGYRQLCIVLVFGLSGLPLVLPAVESIGLEEVLRRTLESYPSLQIARLEVSRARDQMARVESQLGWTLGAQAGVQHDLSFFGTPSDRLDAGANLRRTLESGNRLELNAGYAYEDNSVAFSPFVPNPAHTTNLDLNLRVPLRRGAGNPDYEQNRVVAEAEAEIARADWYATRDQVAEQAMEIYYAAVLTQARLDDAQLSIERAQRLQSFINENADLGLSEEKDRLQADARLSARQADQRSLGVAWQQQRTLLNRLMGRPWDAELRPAPLTLRPSFTAAPESLFAEVEDNSPALHRYRQQIAIAEATIERSRDRRKDVLDLVVGVGARAIQGDSTAGDQSDEELVGGVRIEFSRALDPQGLDAEVRQAALDRDIATEEMQRVRDDLRYQVASLVAQIKAAELALADQKRRLETEQRKLDEAVERYRAGRIDTARLIDFESDVFLSELAVIQQEIELESRHAQLALLRGSVWQRVATTTEFEQGATP